MTRQIDSRKLLTSLEFCEVDSSLAPDCRRTLREERESLASALRSGDGRLISEAAQEAVRVAEMWGARVAY